MNKRHLIFLVALCSWPTITFGATSVKPAPTLASGTENINLLLCDVFNSVGIYGRGCGKLTVRTNEKGATPIQKQIELPFWASIWKNLFKRK